MTRLTAAQRSARNRALGTLGIAALICFAALWSNRPSRKQVDFEVVCRGIRVPVPMSLDLNAGETQIREAVLFDFEGAIGGLARVQVEIDDHPSAPAVDRITLTRDPALPPPYLRLTPGGALGTATLAVGAGATLAIPEAESVLRVEVGQAGDAHLILQTGAAAIDGNRYRAAELAPAKAGMNAFTVAADGGASGLFVDLLARAPQAPRGRADIAFAETPRDRDLLDRATGITLEDVDLELRSATHPSIRLGRTTPAGLNTDHAQDINITARSGTLHRLAVTNDPDQAGALALRVSGSVDATSVRQAGRELLPTWIEEALTTSSWERSASLAALGVAAFILFKLVDRAVDILMALYLRE